MGHQTFNTDQLGFAVPSSGLIGWFSDTLGLGDGTAVASWTDLSGNGNHATQSTSTKRPLQKTNILNGRPSVRFDGVDDLLLFAHSTAFKGAHTIMAVQQYIAVPTDYKPDFGYSIVASDAGSTTDRGFTHGLRLTSLQACCYPLGTSVYDPAGRYQLSRPFVSLFEQTSNSATFYKNENLEGAAGLTPSTDVIAVHMAAQVASSSSIARYSNMDFFEVLIWNRSLSANEQRNVSRYLTAKWNA